MEYRRVMIMRSGYAIVPAMSDQEALEKTKELQENDFDWESVSNDLLSTAEVVEQWKESMNY